MHINNLFPLSTHFPIDWVMISQTCYILYIYISDKSWLGGWVQPKGTQDVPIILPLDLTSKSGFTTDTYTNKWWCTSVEYGTVKYTFNYMTDVTKFQKYQFVLLNIFHYKWSNPKILLVKSDACSGHYVHINSLQIII